MSWLRLDDGFASHPKVAGLSDRAFRAHIKGMLYCARYETDGEIPRNAIRELSVTSTVTRELERAGLWKPENGSYLIHDYLNYNPSKEDMDEKRRQAAERQRNARLRRESQRDSQRDTPRDFAESSPSPQPQPLPHTPLNALAEKTPDEELNEGDPLERLFLALPDRNGGTEKTIRNLVRALPRTVSHEAALCYVRDELTRTGGASGKAVTILKRIVNEGQLVTPFEERTA